MARVAHRGPLVTTPQLTSVRMGCHRRQRQDDSKAPKQYWVAMSYAGDSAYRRGGGTPA
jgi:hypothetical protein